VLYNEPFIASAPASGSTGHRIDAGRAVDCCESSRERCAVRTADAQVAVGYREPWASEAGGPSRRDDIVEQIDAFALNHLLALAKAGTWSYGMVTEHMSDRDLGELRAGVQVHLYDIGLR
jgi:hypothetical protein